MRSIFVVKALGLIISFFLFTIQLQAAEPDEIGALSKSSSGETNFWVEITLEEAQGSFYTFWPNGTEGPDIQWRLPEGVTLGNTLYPKVEAREVAGQKVFGFSPGTVILQAVHFPGEAPPDQFTIGFSTRYAACRASCDMFEKSTTVSRTRGNVALLDTAKYAGRGDFIRSKELIVHANAGTNQQLTLGVNFRNGEKLDDIERVYFLPFHPKLLAGGQVMELIRSEKNFYDQAFTGYLGTAPLGSDGAGFERVTGLVLFELTGGRQIQSPAIDAVNDYRFVLELGPDAMEPLPGEEASLTFLTAILFAFLGGIILNIMPCVLPVLALKVFSFMKAGSGDAARLRKDGIAYTLGILVSFAALGVLLMGLRTTFGDFAWGFQLQQPAFVFAISLLLFAVALNFLGAFEISAGRFAGFGQRLAGREGTLGSFSTGVLATIVATPCTAPFMAAALAFALAQPAGTGVAIFLALGAGLAFPYLVLSFIPKLGEILPKPGPWMTTFKQFLAFPIFGTVIWLLWILAIQAGAKGVLITSSALLLLALAAWFFTTFKKPALRGLVAAALVAAALIPLFQPKEYLPAVEGTQKLEASRIELVEYDAAELERLRAEGTPVFLHFWAAWCPICILHEEYVFLTDEFQDFAIENDIVFMYIDNTMYTPRNTRLMESFGRSGQPIDVFFPPAKDPVVLPEFYNTTYILKRLAEEMSKTE